MTQIHGPAPAVPEAGGAAGGDANPGIEQAGPWERYLIYHFRSGKGENQVPPNGIPNSHPGPDGRAGWRGRWEQRVTQIHGPAPAVPEAGGAAGGDAGGDA